MVLAAVVLSVPLLYALTDLPRRPTVWRFSKRQLLFIVVYGAGLAVFLRSYAWTVPRWLAGLRAGVVAVAATLLANVLIGEAALTLLEPSYPFEREPSVDRRHAADPDLGHVYEPNIERQIQTREYRSTWRTNGEAVRADRDYGKKPEGVVRILVIGDSFTAGSQVDLEQTYPGVMQAEFDRLLGAGRVEVINAGHPAYATVHARRWVKKFGARFEPDIVLHGMTPNDLTENRSPLMVSAEDGHLRWRTSTPANRARWHDRQQWYSVPGWLERSRVMALLDGAPAIRRLRYGYVYPHRHVYQIEQDPTSRERYALLYEHLDGLRANTAELGAELALVVIPFREQMGELGPNLDAGIFPSRVAAYGDRHGVAVFDALPAFRAHPDPAQTLYWRLDAHCSAEGYRLVGETAARGLLERVLALGGWSAGDPAAGRAAR